MSIERLHRLHSNAKALAIFIGFHELRSLSCNHILVGAVTRVNGVNDGQGDIIKISANLCLVIWHDVRRTRVETSWFSCLQCTYSKTNTKIAGESYSLL